MAKNVSDLLAAAQERAAIKRQNDLEKRDRQVRLRGCAAAGRAGLVPYTTSQTVPSEGQISAMVMVSHAHSRLSRLKHHVRTAGRLVAETMSRSGRKWRALFVTLTYRPGVEWSPRHVSQFIDAAGKWSRRRGFKLGYLWVAEMQQRGAVHYHAVVWVLSRYRMPAPDKKGWWPHGTTNVQPVKRNAIGYLMKYVSKGCGGEGPGLPSGCRVCGSGGLDSMARDEFHYWRLPRYVREHVQIGERCARADGGGWVSRESGEVWRSEWGLFGIARVKKGEQRDSVTILSNEYRREAGGHPIIMPDVVAAVEGRWREMGFDLVNAPFMDLQRCYGW